MSWEGLKASQKIHRSLHIGDFVKRVISNHDRSCSICIRDDKVRTRAYKNFLIYITNRWGLEDATNETNRRFEALKNAIVRYKKDEVPELRNLILRDIQDLLSTVYLKQEPIFTKKDTARLIFSVAYTTNTFAIESLIETTSSLVYNQIAEEGNYLTAKNTPSVPYVTSTPYVGSQTLITTKEKGREEISPISSPFLAPAGSAGSVSPLLPQYNTTVIPQQIPGGFRTPTPGYNTIFNNQTLYGLMSGFTGNYYWGVPNVNQSRIPVRTLGTIQEGGQLRGFNMYNTSTITQIPTNTQTTTPAIPTSTQATLPINTQTTTPPISTITQTTTPQVPVSNVTTLPNILQTITTPVGTTTGITQGGSSTGNPGNGTRGFNFFSNLYGNTGGLGYNPPQSQGFGFNNTQNLPPGFGGGFEGGFRGGNPGGPPGGPGGPPGGGGNPGNNNPGGLDPNVTALVNALTGMNIGGEYVPREGNFVKLGEFGGTETEDLNEWLERFNRIAEANMWTEYRRFQIIGGYLVGATARWYDKVKGWIGSWGGFQQAFLQKFASPARKNTWYLKYKNCKQAGRTIDTYALEFQAN